MPTLVARSLRIVLRIRETPVDHRRSDEPAQDGAAPSAWPAGRAMMFLLVVSVLLWGLIAAAVLLVL
jgi:hypothetical protein